MKFVENKQELSILIVTWVHCEPH